MSTRPIPPKQRRPRWLETAFVAATLGAAASPAVHAEEAVTAAALPAQRVSIDPESGQLRQAEHATAKAAPAAAARGAAPAARSPLAGHPAAQRLQQASVPARMGAIGRRVDLSKLSFSVVRTEADGTLSHVCVAGEDAALHALHAPTAVEVPHDR
jgi:hypothetical protein